MNEYNHHNSKPGADLHWRRSSLCASSSCIEVAALGGGGVAVRGSNPQGDTVITYSRDEWLAFIAGVKAGDFDGLAG